MPFTHGIDEARGNADLRESVGGDVGCHAFDRHGPSDRLGDERKLFGRAQSLGARERVATSLVRGCQERSGCGRRDVAWIDHGMAPVRGGDFDRRARPQ